MISTGLRSPTRYTSTTWRSSMLLHRATSPTFSPLDAARDSCKLSAPVERDKPACSRDSGRKRLTAFEKKLHYSLQGNVGRFRQASGGWRVRVAKRQSRCKRNFRYSTEDHMDPTRRHR